MTPSSGFTSSSPQFFSLATQRKAQVLSSVRTKTSRYLSLPKATKLFEGRPHSYWLPKVSASFNSYGMHGTFQSFDLRTSFRSFSLSFLPSPSVVCSMSRLLLLPWQSSSSECVWTSLESISSVSLSASLARMEQTSTIFSSLLSRSDMLSRGPPRSTFL